MKRFEAFIKNEPEFIHNLYSTKSDFIKFFPQKEDYVLHFSDLRRDTIPLKLNITKEIIKSTLAYVYYIERFFTIEEGEIIYYSKTVFIKEDSTWRILKETREKTIFNANRNV
ncbi:MAG: hypothetical protein N3C60_00880 [Calditerrivibrio sp.]|nr:hypothetical protein [Calditerrivibrio sp.]